MYVCRFVFYVTVIEGSSNKTLFLMRIAQMSPYMYRNVATPPPGVTDLVIPPYILAFLGSRFPVFVYNISRQGGYLILYPFYSGGIFLRPSTIRTPP